MKIWKEKFMKSVFFIAALMSIAAVLLICVFLFGNGIPAIKQIGFVNFLLGKEWAPSNTPPSFGIFTMIIGSLYVTAGAIVIGVPIGILTAIYLVHYCPKSIYRILKPAIDLLAGIPSIVFGFFGITVIVPLIRHLAGGKGTSILAASILLGIMILPTVIGLCQSAISAVPENYYEGALALGASKTRSIFFVVLPAAKMGVLSAIILGIGRAIGETMAVVMVAGNQARIPNSIFQGVRTMTANIVLEMGYASGLHRGALIATGVVLFAFILIINLCFSILKRKER